MLVNSLFSSTSDLCGISIFSRHLCEALSRLGLKTLETNLHNAADAVRTPVWLLHYVPSGFASPKLSQALSHLLISRRDSYKLVVLLHGIHRPGETRLLDDTICPDQDHHINLMLHSADAITALSDAAARACRQWRTRFGGQAKLLKLDHPGLFEPVEGANTTRATYALLGGISRSKKKHSADSIALLIDQCEREGVRIWEHWTNIPSSESTPSVWRRTSGLLTDLQWGRLISHARVVLCPYGTQIQSVSGLISEALSAKRFVLSTSFDLAVEMKWRAPGLVVIDDDLQHWPHLIRRLPRSVGHVTTGIPTWDAFATCLAREFSTADFPDSRCLRDGSSTDNAG